MEVSYRLPFEIASSYPPPEIKRQMIAVHDFKTKGSFAEQRIGSFEDAPEKEIELISDVG